MEARGIPARRAETAQRARQGSPVAKRRAQIHRRLDRVDIHRGHHRRTRHLHRRRDRHGHQHNRHHHPYDGAHLHCCRNDAAASIVAHRLDSTNRDADIGDGMTDTDGTVVHEHTPRPPALTIALPETVMLTTGGGAAAERAARSAGRDAKSSAGGGGGVQAKRQSRAARPGSRPGGATRPVMALRVIRAARECRAPSPCRRGWR